MKAEYTDTSPKGVALNLVMAGASACLADAATFPFDTVKGMSCQNFKLS